MPNSTAKKTALNDGPPANAGKGEITLLLQRWCDGQTDALDHAIPLIYNALKQQAKAYLKSESAHHTLQPTALINEVYLQLLAEKNLSFPSRHHFFGFSGHLMRHILIKHARTRLTQKRGEGNPALPLEEAVQLSGGGQIDFARLLDLDRALRHLERLDSRQTRIVELRFFAGMTHAEIGRLLAISERTVIREWNTARCWLLHALAKSNRLTATPERL